jgi:hypothetical protein
MMTIHLKGSPPLTYLRLAVATAFLAAGLAADAVLGPFVLDAIRYRVSHDMQNQVIGGDAAMLLVAVPVAVFAAILLWRGHRAGPVVALAPAVFALYTMPQLIAGDEYLELPGNNERFFALQLGIFVLAGIVLVGAWRTAADARPTVSRRLARVAGWVLVAIAAFLLFGLHLPGLLDAWRDQPTSAEYLQSPTSFWLVKMMDLGIVVPIATATGIGLLRGRAWADRLTFAMIGGYAVLATSVTGMAITMQVNNDPDASVANVIVFAAFSMALAVLAVALYRPLFRRAVPAPSEGRSLVVPASRADARVR